MKANNMTHTEFAYWLQGFVELNGKRPTEEQWNVIKEHLQLTFKKVTTNTVPTYCSSQSGGGRNDEPLPTLLCSSSPFQLDLGKPFGVPSTC